MKAFCFIHRVVNALRAIEFHRDEPQKSMSQIHRLRRKNMKAITFVAITFVLMAIVTALEIPHSTTAAQEPPVDLGGGIEGTWLFKGGMVDCTTGVPLGPPPGSQVPPTIASFSRGGTYIQETGNVPPTRRYPGLGVWRHLNARNYALAFLGFQYAADGSFNGKVISNVEVEHNSDDTLSNSAFVTVHNAAGDLTSTFCLKTVGTRFTGED
jgi:hypothetical protein